MQNTLLTPKKLNTITLNNRIIMAPMGTNLGQVDGHVNEALIEHYSSRARGGVGMVTVEVASIDYPYGLAIPNAIAISDREFLSGLEQLANAIKEHGAKASIQIHHAGPMSANDFAVGNPIQMVSMPSRQDSFPVDRELSAEEQALMVGNLNENSPEPRFHILSAKDIHVLVRKYVNAIALVKEAGFDAVELQAGHGYLLGTFLSPYWNTRTDEYGGSTENRLRIIKEILSSVRQKLGQNFPVYIRLNAHEFDMEGGITIDTAIEHARLCESYGAAAIHVTAFGHPESGAAFGKGPIPTKKLAYLDYAASIKQAINIPVIAVGRFDHYSAAKAIEEGKCDFVAMARPLLRDPELVNKLASDKATQIKPCINCDSCVGEIFLNRSAACVLNLPKALDQISNKRIVINGSGPNAIHLALHLVSQKTEVNLVTRGKALGGLLNLFKEVDDYLPEYLSFLNNEVNASDIKLTDAPSFDAPDLTIDFDHETESSIEQVLKDKPQKVTINGSDQLAFYLADLLSINGVKVDIIKSGGCFGESLSLPKRWDWIRRLKAQQVNFQEKPVPDDQLKSINTASSSNMEFTETYQLNQITYFLTNAHKYLAEMI